MQFHWIFVMVAGGLILLFFFSIALKQRSISEKSLSLTLVSAIEDKFSGAIASTGTAQMLPVPPQGIEFKCSEGCNCRIIVDDAERSFGERPIFAAGSLRDEDLVVWALDWKVPFRATNFLFITNPLVKYYFVHSSDPRSQALLTKLTRKLPPFLEYEEIPLSGLNDISYEGHDMTVFVGVNADLQSFVSSYDWDEFKKKEVRIVEIDETNQQLQFYEKRKRDSEPLGPSTLSYLGLPSIYAAIFSDNDITYSCGMKTAFKRLSYVSELYAQRAETLNDNAVASDKTWCVYGPSIDFLREHGNYAKEASLSLIRNNINAVAGNMATLERKNRELVRQCPELF